MTDQWIANWADANPWAAVVAFGMMWLALCAAVVGDRGPE